MIKTVTVTNYLGENLVLDLANPERSGFAVLSIEGIGPGKAVINTTDWATTDGSFYNSSRLQERNITMKLRFLWNPDIETTRYNSYRFFPVKRFIKLSIETDTRIVVCEGYVETNEPNIFDSAEGCSISIICPDPYMYSGAEGIYSRYTTAFSGINQEFEFEFSNESTSSNLIEFSSIENKRQNAINYTGEGEVGIIINMNAIGTVKNVTIANVETREVMKLNVTMQDKDIITISTERGNKKVTLLRNGVTTNIINCLDKNTDWFKLTKGANIFAFTADEGAEYLQFSVENRIMYEGA